MARRQRRPASPLRVVCPEDYDASGRSSGRMKPWRIGGKLYKPICSWTCVRPVKAARFQSRYRKNEFAVLHPSTKKPGHWQVSYFDADGAVGDRVRATCDAAAGELNNREFKLVEWE